jgi:hypothetical protein
MWITYENKQNKLRGLSPQANYMVLVRKLTTSTEWPQLVGEVSVIFCGQRVSCG